MYIKRYVQLDHKFKAFFKTSRNNFDVYFVTFSRPKNTKLKVQLFKDLQGICINKHFRSRLNISVTYMQIKMSTVYHRCKEKDK